MGKAKIKIDTSDAEKAAKILREIAEKLEAGKVEADGDKITIKYYYEV